MNYSYWKMHIRVDFTTDGTWDLFTETLTSQSMIPKENMSTLSS